MKIPSRSSTGKALIGSGSLGLVLSLAATIVSFVLAGRIDASFAQTLAVTSDAIDAVDGSITVSHQVIGTVSESLDTIASTLTTIQQSLTTSTGTLDTMHTFLQVSLPESINSIEQVLPTIQNVATSIDTALRALSKLPIGPSYKPAVPFGQTIQQLSDAIGAIPTALQSLATNVDDLKASVAGLATNITQVSTLITGLHNDVDSAQLALAKYSNTANEAKRVASRTRHDLHTDTVLARMLIVVVGLLFAVLSFAAVWVGRLLNTPQTNEPHSETTTGRRSQDVETTQ